MKTMILPIISNYELCKNTWNNMWCGSGNWGTEREAIEKRVTAKMYGPLQYLFSKTAFEQQRNQELFE